ncbi:GNAT family N-acetyltransferase [Massilia sp. HP4]|uniref:GNAT family N-acetyltransferase n=1 Tax=Massilia sp. HP4 TaxID=2562316 RepID=UPI0010C063E5|nr:GNAT family N-acetyltransferase [Massilia sp. HP4]
MDVLRTERLLLRTWRECDAAPFHALDQDPQVHEFLPGPMSVGQVQRFMQAHNAMQRDTGMCYLAIEVAHSGELAGFVGLKRHADTLPFAPCTDIGWRLGTAHWGQGYAIEGAAACLRHGFEVLGLHEIVSFTVPGNLRSRRVMERLGMRRDPDGDFDHPALAPGHRLARHVLYRLARPAG